MCKRGTIPKMVCVRGTIPKLVYKRGTIPKMVCLHKRNDTGDGAPV